MSAHVAVVGAGLSGLMAASTLQDAGVGVTVFDKGRRPGGRANTREHGVFRFDHGAQYFTIRDPALEPHLNDWLSKGVVAPWDATLVRLAGGGQQPATPARRLVGVPGMVDLSLHLAGPLDVRTGVRVDEVRRAGAVWRLADVEGGDLGAFTHVVVAVPAPQAVPLLAEMPRLSSAAACVDMAPCWAAMLVFAEPLELDFDGAFVTEGPFSWLARNASKPARPRDESWVVHAAPAWTRDQWDVPREEIPDLLASALVARFGPLPPVLFRRAHRWGYAQAGAQIPGAPLVHATAGLAVCGDWCVGGRIEGALLSGMRAAAVLLDAMAT